jgi:hypothetical protein
MSRFKGLMLDGCRIRGFQFLAMVTDLIITCLLGNTIHDDALQVSR